MSNSEQTTKAKQTAEKPKLTPEQREAQRKQALDDAAKKAVSSVTNLRAYLAVQSRFERYSTNNNLLIFAQRPDATRLKSLELWNKEKNTDHNADDDTDGLVDIELGFGIGNGSLRLAVNLVALVVDGFLRAIEEVFDFVDHDF